MHDTLNLNALSFAEPYVYHPHVTLAQGLDPADVEEATKLAKARWKEFQYSRAFEVEMLTFVQNTIANQWLDLVAYELGGVAVVR